MFQPNYQFELGDVRAKRPRLLPTNKMQPSYNMAGQRPPSAFQQQPYQSQQALQPSYQQYLSGTQPQQPMAPVQTMMTPHYDMGQGGQNLPQQPQPIDPGVPWGVGSGRPQQGQQPMMPQYGLPRRRFPQQRPTPYINGMTLRY